MTFKLKPSQAFLILGALFFVGLLGIFINILSSNNESESNIETADITKIANLDPSWDGEYVTIKGTVEDYFLSSSDNVFFELSDGSDTINVVMFNSNPDFNGNNEVIKDFDGSNDELVLDGTVNIYEDQLQIILDEVRLD